VTERSYSRLEIEALQTIARFCDDIGRIIERHGSSKEIFEEDIYLQYSCVFALTQIGEHVKRLSQELKDAHPEIKWKDIAGMRDIISHNYAGIKVSKVRSAVLVDIPLLKEKCRSILSGL